MPPINQTEALNTVVEHALASLEGVDQIDQAWNYLMSQLECSRFNSKRALEVYSIAVNNAVWAYVNKMVAGRMIYRDYKASGIGVTYSRQLTERFISQTGAKDQRPPRRWLRLFLGA